VRTELEFLKDSDVITDELFEKLMSAIPDKYKKDMAPWGVDKLGGKPDKSGISNTDKLADDLASTSISAPSYPPSEHESKRPPASALGYCRAIYDYKSQEPGDLELHKGDKIEITEHLSEDWWKGNLHGKSGVFPSNYCESILKEEFHQASDNYNEKVGPVHRNEKQEYTAPPPNYNQPAYGQPSYGQSNYGPPPMQHQSSYGGYSQFPPPSTNYYPQQQQQQIQQQAPPPQEQQQQQQHQQHHGSATFKKFGSKLGNAAIFGAGATIGSDIVNSIF
jgi:hypothetical protein